jgi:hypothetical protein
VLASEGCDSPKTKVIDQDNQLADSLIKLEQQMAPSAEKPKRTDTSKVNEIKRRIEQMRENSFYSVKSGADRRSSAERST